jgi:hypothetical protein
MVRKLRLKNNVKRALARRARGAKKPRKKPIVLKKL